MGKGDTDGYHPKITLVQCTSKRKTPRGRYPFLFATVYCLKLSAGPFIRYQIGG